MGGLNTNAPEEGAYFGDFLRADTPSVSASAYAAESDDYLTSPKKAVKELVAGHTECDTHAEAEADPTTPPPVLQIDILRLRHDIGDVRDEVKTLAKWVQTLYAFVTEPKKRGRPIGTTGIKKRPTVKKNAKKKPVKRKV